MNDVSIEAVNAAFEDAANGELEGVMGYTEDEIVSRDVVGQPYSSLIDADSTMKVGGQVKVLAWYDNEYGFSNRMLDLAAHVVEESELAATQL